MPTWQPNWQDVRWNFDAANGLVLALREAADRLDYSTYRRSQMVVEAVAEWRGVHRDTFDIKLEEAKNRARSLANYYRDTAERIMQANVRAQDEQQRRNWDRERWRREKDMEDGLS